MYPMGIRRIIVSKENGMQKLETHQSSHNFHGHVSLLLLPTTS